jgi:hypothetical protein
MIHPNLDIHTPPYTKYVQPLPASKDRGDDDVNTIVAIKHNEPYTGNPAISRMRLTIVSRPQIPCMDNGQIQISMHFTGPT